MGRKTIEIKDILNKSFDFETCVLLDVAANSQMFKVILVRSPKNVETFFSIKDIVGLIGINKKVIIENVKIRNNILSKLTFNNQKNINLLIKNNKIFVGGT